MIVGTTTAAAAAVAMEEQLLYTEVPVPLLSTAALLRQHQHHHHAVTRYQPYQRLHQPQFFLSPMHELQNLQRDVVVVAEERHEQLGKTHISCLYPEILSIIFSYLDVGDKGRAAQVCTAWREAAYRKSVWRGVEAKLHLRRSNTSVFESLVKRGTKRVQVLSLRSLKSLRDVVRCIPRLESLNLSGCYNLTDVGISQAFVEAVPALVELNLSLCKQVGDQSLRVIAHFLKNLETLDLGGCSKVTNAGLLVIAWGLKKLKNLELRSCVVKDEGLGHLAGSDRDSVAGNRHLEYLGLQDCQYLSDDALRHVSQGLASLKSINLSFCVNITDGGLKYLARMPSLRDLDLKSCDNITDLGIAYLAEGGSGISSLDVSFCDKIGDQALVHISQGLIHLTSLSLNACQISDEGIFRIAKSLHDLDTLNIGQCKRVTDKGMNALAEDLTTLKFIDLYGCNRITPSGLEKIMKLPSLRTLSQSLFKDR